MNATLKTTNEILWGLFWAVCLRILSRLPLETPKRQDPPPKRYIFLELTGRMPGLNRRREKNGGRKG